jgi:hypothetical protein
MSICNVRVFVKFYVHFGYLEKNNNNFLAVSAVCVQSFSRNKISDLYDLVKIIHRLPTANIVSQEKFNFLTTALLRPTARTLQLSIVFCACIVQQTLYTGEIKKSLCTCILYCNHQVHRDFLISPVYKVYVFQCSETKYSVLLHNPAVHITKQASLFCVHFKSHHYTTGGI